MAVKVKVEDKDIGWNKFLKSISNLKRNSEGSLDVGFFDEEQAKKAVFNEFGTSRIPERAFMRPTVDANEQKYLNQMTKGVERIVDNGIETEAALMPTAMVLQADIALAIRSLTTPPNTESTVEDKGSSNPLVDKGDMAGSVEIRKGK